MNKSRKTRSRRFEKLSTFQKTVSLPEPGNTDQSCTEGVLKDSSNGSRSEVGTREIGIETEEVASYGYALRGQELLSVMIHVNGVPLRALIDTGATNNLLMEGLPYENIDIDTSKTECIIGLGQAKILTIGRTRCNISMGGLNFGACAFDVVPKQAIGFDVLLGLQFCTNNKLIIDMRNRTVTKNDESGAKYVFSISDEGRIADIVITDVTVFAAKSCKIDDDLQEIPFHIPCFELDDLRFRNDSLMFEGNMNNNRARAFDGVFGRDSKSFSVFVGRKVGVSKYPVKVKEGDKLGRLSTILETMDNDEHENDDLMSCSLEIRDIELGEQLSDGEKNQVYGMLEGLRTVFGRTQGDVGRANVSPHVIELYNHSPIWQKPRRFAEPVNREIEEQCGELLSMDIIEPSSSRYSSPIVPIRKKDGQLRLCVDYRKINAVTVKDKFPMPNLADSIYATHDINFYTKLDMVKGYYQIPLAEDSRQYTAFSTAHNHYQFKTLSFGLTNSGIAFQRNMQEILADFGFRNIVIYIDDILIFNRTFDEHVSLVGKVLKTLANHGIKVKMSKCEFFRQEVSFLGHVISREGIRKSPEYIEKIRSYPRPSSVTELRQFLGLVNFQNKFVPHCSEIAKPLSVLTGGHKTRKLIWTEEMNNSFDTLKSELLKDVALSYPDYSEEAEKLQLFVDASGIGAGGVLVQKQKGELRTIAYASMTFTKAQSRYSTIDRELLAIRWGVKTFRPFIFGVSFFIYTDHKPLLFLNNMSHESSRHMRILTELSEYDFQIRYKPGVENSAADAMSRIMTGIEGTDDESDDHDGLPSGYFVEEKVDGGGDSLFLALAVCFRRINTVQRTELPTDSMEIRRQVVDYIMQHKDNIPIKFDKDELKRLRNMKHKGQIPAEYVLLALSLLYCVEIRVYHGMRSPIVYKSDVRDVGSGSPIVNLQCVSGIHFNPVGCSSDEEVIEINAGNTTLSGEHFSEIMGITEIDNQQQVGSLFQEDNHQFCSHCKGGIMANIGCFVGICGEKFCCLVDTGAQISLIRQSTYNIIAERAPGIRMEQCSLNINAIDRTKVSVLGVVKLPLSISGVSLKNSLSCAVLNDEQLPTCLLLGADFLVESDLVIDFHAKVIRSVCGKHRIALASSGGGNRFFYNIRALMCSTVGLSSDDSSESDSESDETTLKVKYTLPKEGISEFQRNNHALSCLKYVIQRSVNPKYWNEHSLKQYKRYATSLMIKDDILFYRKNDSTVPVIPFLLLVEIVCKTHNQLAHVGRLKLACLVSNHFWHPALGKVCRDVCTTCVHCQLFKSASTPVSPPVLKISSDGPFDLLCVDLLQFQRSSRGNVAVLMAIDHCTKFLFAVPLKNKQAHTVAAALEGQVFSKMLRIPKRVLSDNGPEFRANEFQVLLDSYHIRHVYSTRYRASGNGAVERSNRTITNMLRGLMQDEAQSWDGKLDKAVMLYNNSVHSELGVTPSDFIMQNVHHCSDTLPLPRNVVDTWRVGHPRFAPFSIGQKVAHKIPRIGNRLGDKFKKKYDGPFCITKVQTNEVSYEITSVEDPTKCIKVHHKQLKVWHDPPLYLQPFLKLDELSGPERVRDPTASRGFTGAFGLSEFIDHSATESESTDVEGISKNIIKGPLSDLLVRRDTDSGSSDQRGGQETVNGRVKRDNKRRRSKPSTLNGRMHGEPVYDLQDSSSSEQSDQQRESRFSRGESSKVVSDLKLHEKDSIISSAEIAADKPKFSTPIEGQEKQEAELCSFGVSPIPRTSLTNNNSVDVAGSKENSQAEVDRSFLEILELSLKNVSNCWMKWLFITNYATARKKKNNGLQ